MIKNRFATKLASLQAKNPKRFLVAATLFTGLAVWTALGLKFDSSYEALLPQNSPEIQNADQVREMTGGTRQIVAAISGKNANGRAAFAERLAAGFKTIDEVRYVDYKFPVDFFKSRGLWMMDAATLDALIPALEDAVRAAKWQANPMNLHLDEAKDKAELEAAWKRVNDIVSTKKSSTTFSETMESKDGHYTFLLLIPKIKFGDVAVGRKFLRQLAEKVAELKPEQEGLSVTFAGNLSIMQEQNLTMVNDLRAATMLALVAGILLVAFALRRVGAPFLIGTGLLFGVAWTFAFARIAIGNVNIITGFLVSVIIGLGIDFGIHLFLRVQQDIKFNNLSPEEAVKEAVISTFPPALTSALTTAGTFFSFILADFRGFSEFGLIAGMGVLLTLMSSFLVLPPLLLIFKSKPSKRVAKAPAAVTALLPIHRNFARAVVFSVIVVAIYGAINIQNIPFKNNFRKLRGASAATDFTDFVDKNLGTGFNPAVFVVGSIEDAAKLKQIVLKQEVAGFGARKSRIWKVLSPSDLLPQNVVETAPKIARLKEIIEDPKLNRIEEDGGKRADDLRSAREMTAATPWTFADIPKVFTRRMMTLDEKSYLVYVWPDERNESDVQAASWDDELNYLSEVAESAGIRHKKADESLVLAWIYKTILKDGMPLLVVAALVVFAFLLADFRRLRPALLIAFTLACGMLVFICITHLLGMEINMFNMIVLPSIIGIGVDNAVHIYHRYTEEGPGSLRKVIRTTGVAAFLASATTTIGFGAGLISHNAGLKSLGAMAIVGIGSVFLASTLFFPCFLTLLERPNEKR